MANPIPPQPQPKYHPYFAWDAPTRWFHWINALGVIGLIATGLVILNGEGLGLSAEGKIALKSVHVWFGYVMAVNLLWRFVWAFFGNRYARWRAVLPVGAGFMTALQAYVASFLSGEPQQYVGHNPLARIGVSLLFLLLLVQIATGLVLAGTDLFWPPFGRAFAEWIAATGVDPATIQPGASELIDKAAYQSMRNFPCAVRRNPRNNLLSYCDCRRAALHSRGGHRDSRGRRHHIGYVHRPKDAYEKAAGCSVSKIAEGQHQCAPFTGRHILSSESAGCAQPCSELMMGSSRPRA